jgi:hypothetical protein
LEIEMVDFTIRIEGISPLILNRFTDEAAMSATSGTRTAVVGNEKGSPKAQAEKKLYWSVDGETLIVPSPNVFACIIAGGAFHKAGKSKITTQKSSLIPACVAISEVEIPIISKEGWMVDTRAVRIPSTGGRILAHRPIFNDWQLSFTLELDDDFMSASLLRQIVDDAGKRVGLGDFRPACKGPFGRFVVTQWERAEAGLKKAA